jgi:adenylosuccinate lyase
MQEFVQGLGLSADAEARLLALTPGKYTGIADQLVDHHK